MSLVSNMAESKAKKRIPKKYLKLCLRYMFSHVGLFFLVWAYCIVGALMFQAIESDSNVNAKVNAQKTALSIEEARANLKERIIFNATANEKTGRQLIKNWLDDYHGLIIDAISTHGVLYDGTYHDDTVTSDWQFASGLLFTVSIVTTIGYGNVTPKEQFGRFLLIVFALFGIPLNLMFLANIGRTFASFVRVMYARGCCFLFWKKRRENRLKAKRQATVHFQDQQVAQSELGMSLGDPVVNFRDRSDTQDSIRSDTVVHETHQHVGGLITTMHTYADHESVIFVPILLTVGILAIYAFLGTLLFWWWEGWSMLDSAYFNIVSLMTIGFGDFIPGWNSAGTVMGKVRNDSA